MLPVLYSFRRCPYAMRARLALCAAEVSVVLREVVLREKPDAFLAASPSGTVPCLVLEDRVIDESLDVMIWALRRNDPLGWQNMPQEGWAWIARCDSPFKAALDRTKYATRYPETDSDAEREKASVFLRELDQQIDSALFDQPTLADVAIFPFVRQFAFIDKPWFDAQDWPHLQSWLAAWLASPRFEAIMGKHPQWHPGDPPERFPPSDAPGVVMR
ncbi:MAG: glutathione S-transferase [Roseobacter sp.]